jgi:hypothetical protein
MSMTESVAATAPTEGARPVGQPRGPWFVVLIGLLTVGIYWLYWAYKTGQEIKDYAGEGLGGVLWLVIWLVVSIVMWFVAPSEVGKLYSREGKTPPVTGKTGFWWLLPLIGTIVWFVKVQNALNAFWRSKGAVA